jgi:hypothetical protein
MLLFTDLANIVLPNIKNLLEEYPTYSVGKLDGGYEALNLTQQGNTNG